MNNTKKLGIKLLFYFTGLIIMTTGVIISVKSNMGVTPISSIPYTMTIVFNMNLGLTTMIFSVVMVLLQILLLRKQYKLKDLLQLPVGIIFGLFLTICQNMMAGVPSPDSLLIRFILMLISTLIVAIGVFLYVSAGLVPLAPEGFMLVVAKISKNNFASIKIICDVSMVLISLITCLIMTHSFGSVGLGTIISAFLVGIEVKYITKLFGKTRDKLLN